MGNPLKANYTPEKEVAKQLGVTVRTLRNWRQLGIGPAWIDVARSIYYPNAGIPAWLKSLEKKPVRSEHPAR